jgi:hypothetical protein
VAKPPIPVGYLKCTAVGRYGPATWNNIFYFLIGGTLPPVSGIFDAAADAVRDFYTDAPFTTSDWPSSWILDEVRMLYRDATNDFLRARRVATATGSGGTGEPANVAYLVNWSTGDGRRGGKPRNYLVGVLDSKMLDQATLDPSWVATLDSGIATWLSTIAGETPNFELVDMSFVNGKADRATAFPFPISGGNVSTVVATQRRRVDRLRT